MNFEDIKTKPLFIAGPCVIEDENLLQTVAAELVEIKNRLGVNVVFKASFDKANRTALSSFRGPGIKEGLKMLAQIKADFGLPVVTDIHEPHQAEIAAEAVDILQIPAFLCRQTDLLTAAAKTGKVINIKKAQFLSGEDMEFPLNKVVQSGNEKVMLTERGNMYGYNNLVVDFRNIPDMKAFGYPVIMDCTHSVQRPGGAGGKTGGNREFVPSMALAAKAFGADGYFIETHPRPDEGKSDAANMLELSKLKELIQSLV